MFTFRGHACVYQKWSSINQRSPGPRRERRAKGDGDARSVESNRDGRRLPLPGNVGSRDVPKSVSINTFKSFKSPLYSVLSVEKIRALIIFVEISTKMVSARILLKCLLYVGSLWENEGEETPISMFI